ncbi:DNA modification methylase [Kineococcus aurantiacus]|uniref:DNA modification methylase n=1 Tax=Kineococcus aurantiacus TaxID=37633 RepID=A0A7Y9DQV1_9ACTN|nr:DNA modification methylase [Kineococcus aurantiacus]
MKPRILSSCPPGGTVLDPFAGTGRSLTVAIDNDRNGVGFEISDDFINACRTNVAASLARAEARA